MTNCHMSEALDNKESERDRQFRLTDKYIFKISQINKQTEKLTADINFNGGLPYKIIFFEATKVKTTKKENVTTHF